MQITMGTWTFRTERRAALFVIQYAFYAWLSPRISSPASLNRFYWLSWSLNRQPLLRVHDTADWYNRPHPHPILPLTHARARTHTHTFFTGYHESFTRTHTYIRARARAHTFFTGYHDSFTRTYIHKHARARTRTHTYTVYLANMHWVYSATS